MTTRAPTPGKTTLGRMMVSAFNEMTRIEIGEEVRVEQGYQGDFDPAELAKRDDFAGIVRLIEKITNDKELLERLAS